MPVPAGVNAATVRLVLAEGGTALFAGVKNPSYIVNKNGSVTFDLIQVSKCDNEAVQAGTAEGFLTAIFDRLMLRRSHTRSSEKSTIMISILARSLPSLGGALEISCPWILIPMIDS